MFHRRFDNSAYSTAAASIHAAVQVEPPEVHDSGEADELVQAAEQMRRLAAVAMVDAMQAISVSEIHRDQGHASARKMVGHLAGLSGADTYQLDKIRRMILDTRLDVVEKAWRDGRIGIEQAQLLGKVWSNPRTQIQFIADQDWLIAQAKKLSWAKFQQRIGRWAHLHDQDGATPAPDPSETSRNAKMVQDHFSQAWHLNAQLGSLAGSRLHEVWQAYVDAEFALDWDRAKQIHGDATCIDILDRTPAQRRADALCQMAEDAAKNSAPSVRVKRVHNLVWEAESAEELFRQWDNLNLPRTLSGLRPMVTTLDGYVCHDIAAFADLMNGTFRRAIRRPDGVVIDVSEQARFYTGIARLAAELQRNDCYWPGCELPVTKCQIDHIRSAARGGRTTQQNGSPCCAKHNRLKEAGYTVTRLPNGDMRITTPKGDIVR